MKKLLIALLCLSNTVFAQNLGFNGAGFFENYNSDVLQWLKDMHQPFTIRVPGGSISKFHDPYTVRRGWGMSDENIDNWYKTVGFDEDGQGQDKWKYKAEQQPDHSYMDDLIALQKEFPQMQVIYVLNILNSSVDANLNAIRYMVKADVNIVGVEAGNEVYGKYASFKEYITDFEPIFNQLTKEFPSIKKGLVAGANLNRKELQIWNDDLAAYKGNYDAVILHYYYTARELGDAYNAIPKGAVYSQSAIDNRLDNAYRTAFKELIDKQLLEQGVAYAKKEFKNKKIWITEWNTKPSDKLNNTLVNGAWQFNEMVALRSDVEYLLLHNGVSPDKYGMICAKNKFDSEKTQMVRRMAYWAFIMASEVQQGIKINKNTMVTLNDDDEQCFYFTNMDEAYKVEINTNGHTIENATIHYVSGKYIYSSSGATGFMTKGQEPSYEVNSIRIEKFSGSIPKNAFGYIEIKI